MAKMTQLDKAIANLDADILVLQKARERLVAQQKASPTRKAKIVKSGGTPVKSAPGAITTGGNV